MTLIPISRFFIIHSPNYPEIIANRILLFIRFSAFYSCEVQPIFPVHELKPS